MAYIFPGSVAPVEVLVVPPAPAAPPSPPPSPAAVAWAGCSHSAGVPGTPPWNAGQGQSLGPCSGGLGGPWKGACLVEGASCQGRQPSCSAGRPPAGAGHTSRTKPRTKRCQYCSRTMACSSKRWSFSFLPCCHSSHMCTTAHWITIAL